MSLIGREISEFRVQSYGGGAFREVTKADVLGRWSIFFFYPADFTFVCPTELGDLADKYEEFQKLNCEIYSPVTPIMFTKHGMTLPRQSRRFSIPCWQIPRGRLPEPLM